MIAHAVSAYEAEEVWLFTFCRGRPTIVEVTTFGALNVNKPEPTATPTCLTAQGASDLGGYQLVQYTLQLMLNLKRPPR